MALEDMLSGILNDPDSMSRILELAQSLGGADRNETTEQEPDGAFPGLSQLSSLMGAGEAAALDPDMLNLVMQLFSAWNGAAQCEQAQVLQAIRSVSRPDRQEKLDRALRAVRLARVAHRAIKREGETDRGL